MNEKMLATNRRAYHDFFIDETFEAGLALTGSEIKSVRAGQVNLKEAYAAIRNGEAWLIGCHVAAYQASGRDNHNPVRERRLLLHRREIRRIEEKVRQKGYTLVPTRVYLKKNRAKLEVGLARGKKQYDKRESIAARDARREIDRAAKER